MYSYEPSKGHGLRHDPFYSIVGPRPIGWISSLDRAGRANLAPYSFFNAFCDEPHIIGFCSNGWKDTVRNASETGQFVWNLATRQYASAMNSSSASVPHDVDEFELSGLDKAPSVRVGVPRVKESPVNFECVVSQIVRLQGHAGNPADAWMVFGEVVHVHIDERLIVDGIYWTSKAQPILRGGGLGEYLEVRADAIFRMAAPP
jgi:flavin reductase (DIM6/NTAB) family NADH-FMN oxidoreductase RutF